MAASREKRTSAELRAYRMRGFDCLCGNVRMASRALTSAYDRFLAPSGLTSSQLAVLWCVLGAEPTPLGEIATWLVMDKTTASRNLAALVRLGLVSVKPGPDARVRLASSTPKGRKAFAAALPRWKQAQAWVEGRLGPAFADTVVHARRVARSVAAG